MIFKIQNRLYSLLARTKMPIELQIQSGACGFWGDYFMALNGLIACAENGISSRVRWGRRSLYANTAREGDVWDWFFQSPMQKKNVIKIPYRSSANDLLYKGRSTSARKFLSESIIKYASLHDFIHRNVDEYCRLVFGDEAFLGVHYRGTDACSGLEGRLVSVISNYFTEIDIYLEANPGSLIYIATDDQRNVDAFFKRYGQRLRFRECIRSVGGESIHGHYDQGVEGDGYVKAMDVVMDALILSKSSYLIRGHSRVTCFSLCISPDLQYVDIDFKYQGVNRTPWLHCPV